MTQPAEPDTEARTAEHPGGMDAPLTRLTLKQTVALATLMSILLGGVAAIVTWSMARGATDAETRLAIQRNLNTIESVSEATVVNAGSIEDLDEKLDGLPGRVESIQAEQSYIREDVRWLVRQAGGTPSVVPAPYGAPATQPTVGNP